MAGALLRDARALGIRFLRNIRPFGFRGMSLWEIIEVLRANLAEGTLFMAAGAMAYTFFFAIFPTLIFILSLVPYFPIPNLEREVTLQLQQLLPASTFELVDDTLRGMFVKRSASTISVYFLMILFMASRGVMATSNALDALDNNLALNQRMTPLRRNLKAMTLFLVLFLLIIIALTLLIGGEIVLGLLVNRLDLALLSETQYVWLLILNWTVEYLFLLVGVSVLYRYAPSRRQAMRFISTGSVVAGLLIIIAQLGLRFYFLNFATFNAVYGTLGAVMMLLLTFYWLSFALLFGFQLNLIVDHRA
jgi:membrane protein